MATFACKKNNSTYKPPATTTHSTTPVDSGYNISIDFSKSQNVVSGSLTTAFVSATACFSSAPTWLCSSSTGVKVNSVSLNGTTLKFNSSYYIDSTGTISLPPITWVVNGANGIPSFTYVDTTTLGTYTGYSSLPDTIFRNQTTTINVTGVANAGRMYVMINDGTTTFANGTSNGTISSTFSISNLSPLQATNTGTLYVELENNYVRTISGKKAGFSYHYQVMKTVVIK